MKVRILMDGNFHELEYEQYKRLDIVQEYKVLDTYYIIHKTGMFSCAENMWKNFKREFSLIELLSDKPEE